MATPGEKSRFLLWVDAVGGFLVSQSDEVRLGQAVPGTDVDVPLLADLSRHHVTIRRDAEGYWIEPLRETRVAGRRCERPRCLADGELIELGGNVQLRFCQPNSLSATARLDLVSRHQTKPSTQGVLLMSEACVLGPGPRAHVVCRRWPGEVVLLRQPQGLVCCAPLPFLVDGQPAGRRGVLTLGSRVEGEDFSFSLEAS